MIRLRLHPLFTTVTERPISLEKFGYLHFLSGTAIGSFGTNVINGNFDSSSQSPKDIILAASHVRFASHEAMMDGLHPEVEVVEAGAPRSMSLPQFERCAHDSTI
jgi:hypothetical protein